MAIESELVAIPMLASSNRVEIYSGVQRLMGRIYGQLVRPAGRPSDTALVIAHPQAAFLGHYLLAPLAEAGVHVLGLNTRYAGNDTTLLSEHVLLDLGSTVAVLRERGYERIVLVGNSGGGSIVSYYQAEAEHHTVTATPAGDPVDLDGLTPVDALILVAVHSSRARLLTEWLDPSLVNEHDPFTRDSRLDMYDRRNGPPYSDDFLERYRAAQLARNRRITQRCRADLAALDARGASASNLGFVVHRTFAEPAFVDLTIEPSDRAPCTLWGEPAAANLNASSLGRYQSVHSWLSQYSIDDARADALVQLPRVSVPVLIVQGTADECVLPHHPRSMFDAIAHDDKQLCWIPGGTHYLFSNADALDRTVETITTWLCRHGFR